MHYHYKLKRKKDALDWYNSLNEKLRPCVYLEQTLGSNEGANVHLCLNTRPNRTIVMRVGINAFKWFEVVPLESHFINERYFIVLGVKADQLSNQTTNNLNK